MPHNPASRFQPVDVALRNPGVCLFTKSPNGPLIDTGLDFGIGDKPRFAGRVYISVPVIREMAQQAGLVEQFQAWAEAEIEKAYHQGYAEGVKESVQDVDGLVESLHAAADRLGGLRDAGGTREDVAPVQLLEPRTA